MLYFSKKSQICKLKYIMTNGHVFTVLQYAGKIIGKGGKKDEKKEEDYTERYTRTTL